MKLKEILKDYYPPSNLPILEQIKQQKEASVKLKSDMDAWSVDPGVNFLNQICSKLIYSNELHPDKLVQISKQIISDDWDTLYSTLLSLAETGMLDVIDEIDPVLKLKRLQTISQKKLKSRIYDIPNLSDDVNIVFSDAEYFLTPERKIRDILKANPSHRYKYVKERNDCDDFTRIFRGWLSEQGLGNLTIGKCWYKGYNKAGDMKTYHSVVAIVTEGHIYCAEPQRSNVFWEISKPHGFLIEKTKITRLEF